MKFLRNVGDWVWGQIVREVPDDDAICAFDCDKPQCTEGEWETCARRLKHAIGELMPGERSTLEALADLLPTKGAELEAVGALTPANALIRHDSNLL